jgi:phage/conjugal plasmid C-4 type zinc finger TraR family protein
MGDEMDRVQAVNEWWQEECLAEHFRGRGTGDRGPGKQVRGTWDREPGNAVTSPTSPVPSPRCISCGEEIPEARRQAMPGCRRCIDCQTLYERRNR